MRHLGHLASATRAVVLSGLCAVLAASCDKATVEPLPPKTDLYQYSLAVAERARRLAPPETARAIFNIGLVHQRFEMVDRALEVFAQGLKLDRHAADIYQEIGFILSQENRFGEAIEAYQQVLRNDWSRKDIYTRIGLVLTHDNRAEEAIEALRYVVRARDGDERTYYNLGKAYQQSGDLQHADTSYAKALDLSPNLREALYARAEVLRRLGQEEESGRLMEEFRRLKEAADEDERNAEATKDNLRDQRRWTAMTWTDAADLFLVEARRGDSSSASRMYVRECLRALTEARSIDPTYRIAYDAAIKVYRAQQQPTEALRIGREAVNQFPTDAEFLFETAGMILDLTDSLGSGPDIDKKKLELSREAFGLLSTVVKTVPEFSDARREIAKIILFRLRDQQLYPQALDHARQAVTASRRPLADNYDVLAFAYMVNGDPKGARQTLVEGIRQCPDNKTLKDRLENFDQRYGDPK